MNAKIELRNFVEYYGLENTINALEELKKEIEKNEKTM